MLEKTQKIEFQEFVELLEELFTVQQTVVLATKTDTQQSSLSSAPFVLDNRCFYVFVSHLAKHTQDMLAYGAVSLLLIEDEKEAENLFARKRLSLQCKAKAIERGDSLYTKRLDEMQAKFGETVSLLRTLPDFYLMQIEPVSAQFIAGFGQVSYYEFT